MNKIHIIGRLASDPTIRDANGTSVCNFRVAADSRRKDEAGNYIANFYNVDVWRVMGDNCAKYLHKGDRVAIVGDLFARTYTDTKGQTRFSLDVTASDVEFMQDRRSDSAPKNVKPSQAKPANNAIAQDDEEEGLPF